MAAPIRCQNLLKFQCFRAVFVRSVHRSQTLFNKDDETTTIKAFDDDDQQQREAEIEAKRDVCRLPSRYEPWLKSRASLRSPVHASDLKIRNLRKEYARLGIKSGLDPSIMWPTVEEIKNIETWEKEWEPSLQERLNAVQQKEQAEEDYMKKREEEITKNLETLPRLLKAYHEKQKKKEALMQQQKDKRNRLLEEAREYFGYEIDPRDPKFQDMIAKREEEERLAVKKEKRMKRLASKTAAL